MGGRRSTGRTARAGADDAVRRLLDRDLARFGKVDSADLVARLLSELRQAGAGEAIRTLLARGPASHVDLYDPQAIAWPVAELRLAGDVEAILDLATRVADLGGLDHLALRRRLAGAVPGPRADEALRNCHPATGSGAPSSAPPGDMAGLLEQLLAAGAGDGSRRCRTVTPADSLPRHDLRDVARLLAALRAAGDYDAARALAARAVRDAPQARLADPGAAARTAGRTARRRGPRGGPGAAGPGSRPAGPPRPAAGRRPAARGAARRRGPEAAGVLARRAAGAGMFGLFLADRSDEAARPACSDLTGRSATYTGASRNWRLALPWQWAPPDSGAAGSRSRRGKVVAAAGKAHTDSDEDCPRRSSRFLARKSLHRATRGSTR